MALTSSWWLCSLIFVCRRGGGRKAGDRGAKNDWLIKKKPTRLITGLVDEKRLSKPVVCHFCELTVCVLDKMSLRAGYKTHHFMLSYSCNVVCILVWVVGHTEASFETCSCLCIWYIRVHIIYSMHNTSNNMITCYVKIDLPFVWFVVFSFLFTI